MFYLHLVRNIQKHFGLPGGLKRIRKARSVHVLLSHSGWMSEILSLSRLRQQRIFFIDIHSRIALEENSLTDNNAERVLKMRRHHQIPKRYFCRELEAFYKQEEERVEAESMLL